MLVSYSDKILPYNIRAKGISLMLLIVNVALFLNQYVNPVALKNIEWKYYIVYCAWSAVELAVVCFLYVETRYTPLEEFAKHFDGDDAIVGGTVVTEKGKELAAEVGGLDTIDLGEKNRYEVEHREL